MKGKRIVAKLEIGDASAAEAAEAAAARGDAHGYVRRLLSIFPSFRPSVCRPRQHEQELTSIARCSTRSFHDLFWALGMASDRSCWDLSDASCIRLVSE